MTPSFREVQTGGLAERTYWARRAERGATLLGTGPDTRSFMHVLFDLEEDQIVRPEARSLVEEAQTAGFPVGVLTNDLMDFHGRDWVERMSIFGSIDVTVDGSVTGALKPDAEAYSLALEAMGVPAGDVVFLDDQPVNVHGAAAAGLQALLVDVTAPRVAMDQARERLELR